MRDFVEMTEWIRFNDDGSSDHIRVVDGEIFDVQHFDKAPYVQTRDKDGNPLWPPAKPDIDWLVNVTRHIKTGEQL